MIKFRILVNKLTPIKNYVGHPARACHREDADDDANVTPGHHWILGQIHARASFLLALSRCIDADNQNGNVEEADAGDFVPLGRDLIRFALILVDFTHFARFLDAQSWISSSTQIQRKRLTRRRFSCYIHDDWSEESEFSFRLLTARNCVAVTTETKKSEFSLTLCRHSIRA